MILAVIVGSSGKTVVGPALPEPREGEVHKVEGFIIKNDNAVETGHRKYSMERHEDFFSISFLQGGLGPRLV